MQIERRTLIGGGGISVVALFPIAKWLVPWLWGMAITQAQQPLHEEIGRLRNQVQLEHARTQYDLAELARVSTLPASSWERRRVMYRLQRYVMVGPEEPR